jgi:Undecaprenyl-phosphate galactose phosphotransferase WbaP
MGLYPSIGLSPITELRSIFISTSAVFLILGALTFFEKQIGQYSRGIFFISWILCLFILPKIRNIIVNILSKKGLWGDPVVVIGFNDHSRELIQQLILHPEYGFFPCAIFNFFPGNPKQQYLGIPIQNVRRNIKSENLGRSPNVQTAIIVTSEIDQPQINQFLKNRQFNYSRVIMFPSGDLENLWVAPLDIGGILGFDVKQNLLSKSHQFFKRVTDLVILIVTLPFVFLLGLLLAVIIKLDSVGSVFYREQRIGFGGKSFIVWKFRTMVTNANEELNIWLQNHPEMTEEWEKTHKLKNDPRITRVGKFLRRFSLDELPQLINVFHNEMSLVGPRPIVEDEINKYGDRFDLYKKVKPGLSGLWQVSGRNDISYETRVDLDEYYVRNYSIWMDIYILDKTIEAVVSNRGAY